MLASGFLIYAAPTGLHKLTAITYIFRLPQTDYGTNGNPAKSLSIGTFPAGEYTLSWTSQTDNDTAGNWYVYLPDGSEVYH